ncbi:Chaperone protein ClpD, chloroplastic [Sesamum angolense]|uniref:Chaperone protein ClpD, chloroplastic n=1 Tax=Sesamum angolense TaxID=2727404 RepID=A0AAE1WLU2_9LAMI|nr:Chaperone protein ClpD, chloroplastic [Sesamum angolense]
MELSCSPPLSVNSLLNSGPLRRGSASETYRRCQKVVSFAPNCSPSSSYGTVPMNGCNSSCSSSSSSSTYFGLSLAQHRDVCRNNLVRVKKSRRSFFVVSGIFERFTERAIKAVMFSQREAKVLGKDMVFTQHLLLGLVAEDRAPGGFLGSGITIDAAREAVRSLWQEDRQNDENGESPQQSETSATDVPFSASTKRVFEAAVEYSRTMGYNYIAPEHIAIGLFTVDDGSASRVFKRKNSGRKVENTVIFSFECPLLLLWVNVNHLAAVAVSRLQGELAKEGREPASTAFKRSPENIFPEKVTHARSPEKAGEKKALDLFCVDLTARASNGSIDPVIGRDNEVQRIIQILCRRTKSNPILLGEAGVGKTAIAEGLAISIADGSVPSFLMKKRILALDVGLLIAGAKERGELEGRVTMLIKEIKKSGNIILFIDEVHTLIGSGTVGRGNKGSGLDIANLLKPSLGRGELQCIASTTMDEFRSHFEKDKALARRFQPVLISEPSEQDALQILLGVREKYESHHKCVYTLEAINAAVHLSARYIPDRYLPDKAIDLIDEAGSRAHMEASKRKKEKQTSVLSKSPSDYWQEIRAVQARHEALLATNLTENGDFLRMEEDGKLNFDPSLPPSFPDDEPTVVGPEDIAAVASFWSGIPVKKLTADDRMLLVGLNEQLKKRVIGQDEAVSAICRAVKRSRVGLKDPDRPIAAMLFCGPTGVGKTELTKALAATYFGSGRRVSFKNALIVMTSNVGSAAIAKGGKNSFGFFIDEDKSTSYAGMKALVIEELKGYFRPELLNRIDEVVVFRPLEKPQMLEILDIMLHEVKGRLAILGIGLEVSEAVMDLICQQGYDRSYGARPLRRAVTLLIEDLVSESLLSGDYKPGDIAVIHLDDSEWLLCNFGLVDVILDVQYVRRVSIRCSMDLVHNLFFCKPSRLILQLDLHLNLFCYQ